MRFCRFSFTFLALFLARLVLEAQSSETSMSERVEKVVLREVSVDNMPLGEFLEEELPRLIRKACSKTDGVQLVYLTAPKQSSRDALVTMHLNQVKLSEVLLLLCWQYHLTQRITPNAVVLADAALGVDPQERQTYPAGGINTPRTRKRMRRLP